MRPVTYANTMHDAAADGGIAVGGRECVGRSETARFAEAKEDVASRQRKMTHDASG